MELFKTLEKFIDIFQFNYEIKTYTRFDVFYVTLLLGHEKLEFEREFKAFSYITEDNFIQKTYNKLNNVLMEVLPSEHDSNDLMQSWIILQETTTAIRNQYKEIKDTDDLKDHHQTKNYLITTMAQYDTDKFYTNREMRFLKKNLHTRGAVKNKPVDSWNKISFE